MQYITSCSKAGRKMFRIKHSSEIIPNQTLLYRREECSFDVEPTPEGIFTSILVDDLSLEVNAIGKVISVWGMCPFTRWTEAEAVPPEAGFGDLIFESKEPLKPGVSIRITKTKEGYLPVTVDRKSGWVRIRDKSEPKRAVRPLMNVVIEIDDNGQISSLWLKPKYLPTAGSK
jgi:hypothetical protein